VERLGHDQEESVIQRLFRPTDVPVQASAGLLAMRVVVGLAFMLHGWSKIQDPFHWMGPDAATPGIFQALAALSEFGGGLAWILGLLTRLSASGIACTMVVAAWTHFSRGDPFVGKAPTYELALVYLSVAAVLMTVGPGKLSLDTFVFRERASS
jgi:putative oxidoreductase